jgi:hypothetical protein
MGQTMTYGEAAKYAESVRKNAERIDGIIVCLSVHFLWQKFTIYLQLNFQICGLYKEMMRPS